MKGKETTKYQIVTFDYTIKVRAGFDSWTRAYHWAVNHDFGQYEENGGLRILAYTTII